MLLTHKKKKKETALFAIDTTRNTGSEANSDCDVTGRNRKDALTLRMRRTADAVSAAEMMAELTADTPRPRLHHTCVCFKHVYRQCLTNVIGP